MNHLHQPTRHFDQPTTYKNPLVLPQTCLNLKPNIYCNLYNKMFVIPYPQTTTMFGTSPVFFLNNPRLPITKREEVIGPQKTYPFHLTHLSRYDWKTTETQQPLNAKGQKH